VLRADNGDWSYLLSFSLALVMLAGVAFAADAQAIAFGRARLWSALATAGRAAARCLAPAPGSTVATVQGCEASVVGRLLGPDLPPAMRLVSSQVGQPADATVTVAATASLSLPFPLPGTGPAVTISDQLTSTLLPGTATSP